MEALGLAMFSTSCCGGMGMVQNSPFVAIPGL
jgi:hypothetical protein